MTAGGFLVVSPLGGLVSLSAVVGSTEQPTVCDPLLLPVHHVEFPGRILHGRGADGLSGHTEWNTGAGELFSWRLWVEDMREAAVVGGWAGAHRDVAASIRL